MRKINRICQHLGKEQHRVRGRSLYGRLVTTASPLRPEVTQYPNSSTLSFTYFFKNCPFSLYVSLVFAVSLLHHIVPRLTRENDVPTNVSFVCFQFPSCLLSLLSITLFLLPPLTKKKLINLSFNSVSKPASSPRLCWCC